VRKIDLIVVHCSATREGSSLTPEALDASHRRLGFGGTGYHYYVRRDGSTALTRPLERVGAHARGFNAHSVGVCYEGGLDRHGRPADTRTPEQRLTLRLLILQLLEAYPGAKVRGHRDLSPDLNGDGRLDTWEWFKSCPCFDATAEYGRVVISGSSPQITQIHTDYLSPA
jgi:N-acetyl-anhydromuramyl-L-alanine amidase AmpD